MPEAADIIACKDTVVGFCLAINAWERTRTILGRVENGKFTSESDLESVAGVNLESHMEQHKRIFNRFIVPRERKYGSSPGAPNSWSKKGRYHNVNRETIRSVEFPSKNRAEVVADWGFIVPGRKTMFVLKRKNGTWLIDSLKIAVDAGWEVAHL